jgi:hypothetical protein
MKVKSLDFEWSACGQPAECDAPRKVSLAWESRNRLASSACEFSLLSTTAHHCPLLYTHSTTWKRTKQWTPLCIMHVVGMPLSSANATGAPLVNQGPVRPHLLLEHPRTLNPKRSKSISPIDNANPLISACISFYKPTTTKSTRPSLAASPFTFSSLFALYPVHQRPFLHFP